MKIKAIALIIFFTLFRLELILSQRIDYGLNLIYNSSSQTNTDPTIPEDGTFQWNSLGTWGAGIYGTFPFSGKFALSAAINYQKKGYKEIAQVGFIPGGPFDEKQLENTFDYLCADLFLRYKVFKSTAVEGLLGLGFEYGYWLDYELNLIFSPLIAFTRSMNTRITGKSTM